MDMTFMTDLVIDLIWFAIYVGTVVSALVVVISIYALMAGEK